MQAKVEAPAAAATSARADPASSISAEGGAKTPAVDTSKNAVEHAEGQVSGGLWLDVLQVPIIADPGSKQA